MKYTETKHNIGNNVYFISSDNKVLNGQITKIFKHETIPTENISYTYQVSVGTVVFGDVQYDDFYRDKIYEVYDSKEEAVVDLLRSKVTDLNIWIDGEIYRAQQLKEYIIKALE